MKKKLSILFTIIFVLTSLTTIAEEYPTPLSETTYPYIINEATTISFRPIQSTSTQTPLIADLNNDGTNEIIIVDGKNIEIYQNKTLQPLTALPAQDTIQTIILHDINNDGKKEIITAGGDQLTIFSYNGTLNINNNYTIPNIQSSEFEIGCSNEHYCALINARYKTGVPSSESLYASLFNKTGIINTLNLKTATNNYDWALPNIREVGVSDVDNDGKEEFIITANERKTSNEGNLWVFILGYNTSHLIKEKEKDTGETIADFGLTPPTVYDFAIDNGKEIVLAHQKTSDEFEILLYDQNLNLIDDYPEYTNSAGTLISNVLRMNAFTDTGNDDFCVLGSESSNNELTLTCGSTKTSYNYLIGSQTAEFTYDGTAYYDLTEPTYTGNTPDYRIINNKIQRITSSYTTTDGTNLDEVLSAYGIFILDYEGSDHLNVYATAENPQGAMTAVDYENNTRADILYLTTDGLYYDDDGFENQPADITSITSNTGNPICEGVTTKLSIEYSEPENEAVNCWFEETYQNETLKDTSQNTSSNNGKINLYYNADETGQFLLNIYCTDGINNPDKEVIDVIISNNTGTCNAYGSAEYTLSYTTTNEEEEQADFNAEIVELRQNIGLGNEKAFKLLWLIILLLTFFGGWQFTHNLMASASLTGLMLLVGWTLGAVSTVVLVTIALFSIAIITYFVVRGRD